MEEVSDEVKELVLNEKENTIYTEKIEGWKEEYNVKIYPEKLESLIQ